MRRPRILLVDDDPLVLETLGEWLAISGYEVETAGTGADAIALAGAQPFDVVVLDVHMPRMSGLQVLPQLKESRPGVEIVMLTGQGTMEDAIAALREGKAFDFLLKPIRDFEGFNRVLERAAERARTPRRSDPPPRWPDLLEPLSERERQVIGLIAEGLSNREIASRLVISEKTVGNHLGHIYEKLQVANRTGAVAICRRYGVI